MSTPNIVDDTTKLVQAAVEAARSQIKALLITEPFLRPAFVRLAFYDAILQNPSAKVDGPKGAIRYAQEAFEATQDVRKAIDHLEKLRATKFLSYADLYQLAGIEAMNSLCGLHIEFHYGRTDSCIPIPLHKFAQIQQGDDATHVRSIFYPLGFDDKEIVALSAAILYWMNPSLFNTSTSGVLDLRSIFKYLVDEIKSKDIHKTEGSSTINQNKPSSASPNENLNTQQGASSNESMRTFTSTGLKTQPSTKIANFNYWKCLILDTSFCNYVELFAQDRDQITKEYEKAHQKLSELGFLQFPKPIQTEMKEYHDMKHGVAFAVAMTILFGFIGFFYEAMRT